MARMLFVCLVAFLVVLASGKQQVKDLERYTFEQYMVDYKKRYGSTEEANTRRALFEARLKEIKLHNTNPAKTWTKGVNHMSDWTDGERKALLGTFVPRKGTKTTALRTHQMSGLSLPDSIDYRRADPPILTGIKNQGACGSCWAHSATESIETYWAKQTGQLFVLSQEQLTACTPNPNQCGGTGGCAGNIYELGWDYVVQAGGIAEEWSYPYLSYFGTTGPCYNFSDPKKRQFIPVASITGYVKVEENSQEALMDALAHQGPLSVSLDASEWFDYAGGVFNGCNFTNNITIDHGVQLVGYGFDYSLQMNYWIIRNSWSPAWGEDGFIRLHRHTESYCGWNNDNDYQGIGCRGQPNSTWVCGMCGLAVDANYVVV